MESIVDTITCVDCLDGMKMLSPNSIDLVVTSELDRKFIGFDISEEYCKLANERIRCVHKQLLLR